ncbi:alpha/beta fold hydrolase [Nocardioides speluncae]|uniref:alpha/beta fold hydrolase n=1 Tax=Nocardioides speluncae TaxID=2670337 RepID=UPI000D6857A4|nr:alpha/beta hydrolase [Nocardioides speluncae]
MEPSLDTWVAEGERVELAGHHIFFRQDGPEGGRPVTLIHGFPTSSHDWAPIVPALVAAGCRVTTFDLLGFGASDKPTGHAFSILEQATIVEALWSRLGIAETALVAHDYGVSVGQELLDRDSARITAMTWLNGGLYADLHRPLRVQRMLHGPLGGVLGRLATERTYRAAMHEILGRPVSDETLHQMWLAASGNGGKRIQHALLRYINDRVEHSARWVKALESYAGPTLFVWGPADPVSGAHVLPRIRERMPSAELVVLDEEPATGHYPQLENPTAVADALTSFLA